MTAIHHLILSCLQGSITSSFQAVIEEPRFSLCWDSVEGQLLSIRCCKLYGSSVLILVVLDALVGPMERADVRLGRKRAVSRHQSLPHNAFGDHRVFFAARGKVEKKSII